MAKILIISHAAGTPDIGPNLRSYYIGQNLKRNYDHEVIIIGSSRFHKYTSEPDEVYGGLSHSINGVKYHWIKTINYNNKLLQIINQLDFAIKISLSLKKLEQWNPDIIYFTSPPPISIFPCIYLKTKLKIPLFFEVRDLWPEILSDLTTKSILTKLYFGLLKRIVKLGYKNSDVIISVKQGDLDYIKTNYEQNAVLSYVPNGFDINDVVDEYYNNSKLDTNRFKIGYLGGLSDYYNLSSLIEIINETPEIDLIIVGDGVDASKYKKLANSHNVIFLGKLPKKYMLSIAKRCDVLYTGLKNSKFNNHGVSTNKLFEYFYAKKPILGYYKVKENIFERNNFGILVSDKTQLKEAVNKFRSLNQWELNTMGENGYKYLIQNHTYQTIADKINKLILEQLKR